MSSYSTLDATQVCKPVQGLTYYSGHDNWQSDEKADCPSTSLFAVLYTSEISFDVAGAGGLMLRRDAEQEWSWGPIRDDNIRLVQGNKIARKARIITLPDCDRME